MNVAVGTHIAQLVGAGVEYLLDSETGNVRAVFYNGNLQENPETGNQEKTQ